MAKSRTTVRKAPSTSRANRLSTQTSSQSSPAAVRRKRSQSIPAARHSTTPSLHGERKSFPATEKRAAILMAARVPVRKGKHSTDEDAMEKIMKSKATPSTATKSRSSRLERRILPPPSSSLGEGEQSAPDSDDDESSSASDSASPLQRYTRSKHISSRRGKTTNKPTNRGQALKTDSDLNRDAKLIAQVLQRLRAETTRPATRNSRGGGEDSEEKEQEGEDEEGSDGHDEQEQEVDIREYQEEEAEDVEEGIMDDEVKREEREASREAMMSRADGIADNFTASLVELRAQTKAEISFFAGEALNALKDSLQPYSGNGIIQHLQDWRKVQMNTGHEIIDRFDTLTGFIHEQEKNVKDLFARIDQCNDEKERLVQDARAHYESLLARQAAEIDATKALLKTEKDKYRKKLRAATDPERIRKEIHMYLAKAFATA